MRTKTIDVKGVSPLLRLLDYLMIPIMFTLSGFRTSSLQETHPWHIQEINPALIDLKFIAGVSELDSSKHTGRNNFFFRAPIFGGWTKYSVIDFEGSKTGPFHIGWVELNEDGSAKKAYIHTLPIYDKKIRMLNGTTEYRISFFGLSNSGIQIPVQITDQGTLGHDEHKNVRLF